jgi:trimethylamine monooxygenase
VQTKVKLLNTLDSIDNSKSEFIFNVENSVDNLTSRHRFDNLIIATGHFTSQVTPHIKELVSFNSPVLHSYHFRDPKLD